MRTLFLMTAFALLETGVATAAPESCRAQTAALQADQAEIETQSEEIERLRREVEALNEDQASAVSISTLSDQYAREAQAAREAYQALREVYDQAVADQLRRVDGFNAAADRFNRECAR